MWVIESSAGGGKSKLNDSGVPILIERPIPPTAGGSLRCGRLGLMDVRHKTLEAAGNLRVPFIPIVTAWLGVKFEGEIALLEKRNESTNWRQKWFLFSCRDVEVWRTPRVSGFHQNEGIAVDAHFASRGTEGGPEAHTLRPPPCTEASAGHIDGRTDGTRKGE